MSADFHPVLAAERVRRRQHDAVGIDKTACRPAAALEPFTAVARVALTSEGRRFLGRFEQACAIGLADVLSGLTAAQRQRIRAAFNDLREVVRNENFTKSSQPESNLRSTKGHKEMTHAR